MLSDYQLQFIEDNNFSYDKNEKLISNLSNKIKYKLQDQNLKLYLILGLQFEKIEYSNKNHFYNNISNTM